MFKSYDRRDFLKKTLAASAELTTKPRAQGPASLFPGFERRMVKTSGATINTLRGGSGPPLLLLHGYPQTHVEWHKIAPRLAQKFTVVVADLRGYGDSTKPPDGENHSNYSKRAMALDMVDENLTRTRGECHWQSASGGTLSGGRSSGPDTR